MNRDLPPGLPPDPFAGDPSDPSSELDALEPYEPLDDDERKAVREDLRELEEFRRVLSPLGIRGVAVQCADCEEEHLHDWDMLRASLEQLLAEGMMLPHEPAFEPDPADYATWEYCRGYADAVADLGSRRPRWRR